LWSFFSSEKILMCEAGVTYATTKQQLKMIKICLDISHKDAHTITNM